MPFYDRDSFQYIYRITFMHICQVHAVTMSDSIPLLRYSAAFRRKDLLRLLFWDKEWPRRYDLEQYRSRRWHCKALRSVGNAWWVTKGIIFAFNLILQSMLIKTPYTCFSYLTSVYLLPITSHEYIASPNRS